MKFGISTSSFQYEENSTNSHLFHENKTGNFHKKHWKEDLFLVKNLGVKYYRFSIEWSQIQPRENEWNTQELQRYETYIDFLQKNDIEPILCLFHFSCPKWFMEEGGFLKVPEKFYSFANYCIQYYKKKVKYFITYNEPNVYATCCYLISRWNPYCKSIFKFKQCVRNMTEIHNQIVEKFSNRNTKIGVVINIIPSIVETFLNGVFQDLWNDCFFKKMVRKTNFIGINYYFSRHVQWSDIFRYKEKDFFKNNKKDTMSNLGWPICPHHIANAVDYVHKRYPNIDIWITENGLSTQKPNAQYEFIENHVKTLQEKCPYVQKYFYWTLIDCFEWDYGKNAHFGLVAVNKQYKRKPKSSYYDFQKLISKLQS
jgi:beta-glucosidase